MPNVIDVAQRIVDRPPLAVLTSGRCLSERDLHASCTTCADACPTGAARVEAGTCGAREYESISKDAASGPRIDLQSCAYCGACVTACPVDALIAISPHDDDTLLAACAAAGSAAREQAQAEQRAACEYGEADDPPFAPNPATMGFACVRSAKNLGLDVERTLILPCLAWVDAALILHAACAGAQRVFLLSAPCASCEHRQAVARLPQAALEAQRIAHTWGIDLTACACEEAESLADAQSPAGQLSRRDLLSQARSTLADAAAEALPTPVKSLVNPHLTATDPEPDRRRWQLLDDLHGFGLPANNPIVPRNLAPRLSIDVDHCSGCTLCAQFCPTGALRKAGKATGGGTVLEFDAPLCRDCGVCAETCRYGALSCEETLTATELFALEPHRIIVPKRRVLPSRR
ncbi:4Fe-4S ferredoxin [Paraeggerthella hongkongensis]|uniref:4Fe-4S binding protein n=1 Tax=Paraeggerthella sp. TaxID=2897350 RepID=UPI000DF84234|nr:4Fe-4S ferredoxin [Paraeggerthella hongkongensis]